MSVDIIVEISVFRGNIHVLRILSAFLVNIYVPWILSAFHVHIYILWILSAFRGNIHIPCILSEFCLFYLSYFTHLVKLTGAVLVFIVHGVPDGNILEQTAFHSKDVVRPGRHLLFMA